MTSNRYNGTNGYIKMTQMQSYVYRILIDIQSILALLEAYGFSLHYIHNRINIRSKHITCLPILHNAVFVWLYLIAIQEQNPT